MSNLRCNQLLSASLFCWLFLFAKLAFAEPTAGQFVNSVVRIDTTVISSGRTVKRLGAQRSGSGVIIDANGLLVTAGYLVLEANTINVTFNDGHVVSAELIANDDASGLALLKTSLPADFSSMTIGRSSVVGVGEEVLVLSHGGVEQIAVVSIADIRGFSAAWEYHIDSAFYTRPVYPVFSGAALINKDAELIGIGSLLLSDINDKASEAGRPGAGNVFIPIEYLTANLGELLARGRSHSSQRAWLGVYLAESEDDLRIVRLAEGGPAELAGLQQNDSVIAIDGQRIHSMEAFYKSLWSSKAGSQVELLLSSGGQMKAVEITTSNLQAWLHSSIE